LPFATIPLIIPAVTQGINNRGSTLLTILRIDLANRCVIRNQIRQS
jgi:hypothetical protein